MAGIKKPGHEAASETFDLLVERLEKALADHRAWVGQNAGEPIRVIDLATPIVVDSCRLDAWITGPDGEHARPYLTVLLTPSPPPLGGRVAFPSLPATCERSFRKMADTVRDALKAGQ